MQPLLYYRSYLGIDQNAADLHRALATQRGPAREGDVTNLDLSDASVDTVGMTMALMLVPLQSTLAEVRRVLRPGGTFVAKGPGRALQG